MLKSILGACTLLLFADGLSKPDCPVIIEPSDRFMGLIGITSFIMNPPLRLFSALVDFNSELSSWLEVVFSLSSPTESNCIMFSLSASVELRFRNGIGDEFPPSLKSVKARLVGDFGEVRVRITPCVCAVRRRIGL